MFYLCVFLAIFVEFIEKFAVKQNLYLTEHKKAKTETAQRRIEEKIFKLKMNAILSIQLKERDITIVIDEEKKKKEEELDGCYVVKTDVPKENLSTKDAHDRYKDLSKIESAFRTMKTTLEKIRPVFVRKEERTRGHVFVAMLACMIVKQITDELKKLNFIPQHTIESLDKVAYLKYQYEGETRTIILQNMLPHQQQIIDQLELKLR